MSLSSLIKKDSWVKPFIQQYKKTLFISLALGVATLACAVALMFSSGYLISASAEHPEDGIFALFSVLAFVQLFGIGKPFLGYLERLKSHDWVLKSTSHMRQQLFVRLAHDKNADTRSDKAGKVGKALSLLSQDIAHIQDLYLRSIFPLLVAWILAIIASLVFGFFDAFFGLGMLILFVVLTVLIPLVSVLRCGAAICKEQQQEQDEIEFAYDYTAGLADWLFSGRQVDYCKNICEQHTQVAQQQRNVTRHKELRDFISQVVFCLACCAVIVWTGYTFGMAVQSGAGLGDMSRPALLIAAFCLGFLPLMEAFAPSGQALLNTRKHLESVERLNSLEEETPQATVCDIPQHVAGRITISDMTFAYKHSRTPLFKDFSLDIPAHEKWAILGPSGSGKSTLLSLLKAQLAPNEGTICLDGCNITNYGEQPCNYIGVIQQETYLFNQSLYDNLRIANPELTKEDAIAALKQVKLEGLLERLPQGIDTIADEAGLRFSGGERHRIALARILVKNTPVVLLDEPCCGLDPKTERDLLTTLFEVLKNRTLIMVTHHLEGLEHMDHIVFMDHGSITMQGTPDELANNNARYQQLLAFDKGL